MISNIDNLQADLFSLPKLEVLEISNNQLSEFPEFICDITSLKKLNLGHNQHITSIPMAIQHLTKLESLSLPSNAIAIIPSELAQLLLTKLDLGSNRITEIPDFIYSLFSLEDLSLAFNEISKVSPKIKYLKNLKKIYLLENYLTDLPIEITELTQTTFINVLIGNDLHEVDQRILKFIEVRSNPFNV